MPWSYYLFYLTDRLVSGQRFYQYFRVRTGGIRLEDQSVQNIVESLQRSLGSDDHVDKNSAL